MIGIYILLGGITLFVGIITAMDEWTRRQDRKQRAQRQTECADGSSSLSKRNGFSRS